MQNQLLFVLNRQEKVVSILKNTGENTTPFFDDTFTEDLATGAETFQFTTISKNGISKHLQVGNYIAFKKDKKYKLLQIVSIEEDHQEELYITVYCECAGLQLINSVFRGVTINSATFQRVITTILSDTGWNVGALPYGLNTVYDLEIEQNAVYSLLQTYSQMYEVELEFRVEINRGRISKKYVDAYYNRGRNTGKRFTYDRDIESIVRKTDSTTLCTALIGKGNNGINFRDVTVEGIPKPAGQDFVADQDAFDRYNNNGYHIMGTFEYDTDSPQELLLQTYKQLLKVNEPKIEYNVGVLLLSELLGEKVVDVRIGDTIRVFDNAFDPPIMVTARVSKLETSMTDPLNNKCTLSNFVEMSSNITDDMRKIAAALQGYVEETFNSKFPIGGDDIKEGAIQSQHIYKDSITTEHLIADAITAEKIKAGSIEAEHIVADSIKAEHIAAESIRSEHIYAEQIEGYHIKAGAITADSAIIGDAAIGTAQIKDAEITVAKVQDAFIENLVAVQGKLQSAHIGVLTSDNINANTITAEYIKSTVIDAINLNASGTINANKINTDGLTVNSISAKAITSDDIDADRMKTNVITAVNSYSGTATINSAKIGNLDAGKITTGDLKAEVIKTNVITAINAAVGKISADKIDVDSIVVDNLDAGVITTGDLKAEVITTNVIAAINSYVGTTKIKQAQIESLKVGTANITDLDVSKLTGGTIDAKFIDADSLEVNAANIQGTLTADKIKGGTLDANDMTVLNLNAQSITVGKINGTQIATGTIAKTNLDSVLAGEINSMTENINQILEDNGLIVQELEVVNQSAVKNLLSYYAKNQNATTAPTTGWSTTIPSWQDGYYIWEKIETEYLDGTKVMGGAVNITGAKGATGSQGPTGPQGLSSYTHIAYATGTTGQNFNVNHFASATYIGMYVDNTAADSTDYTKYAWNLIKGADGSQGIQGPKGDNGQTPYFHTAWATNATGTTGFSTTDSVGKTHIGVYTDYTSADSTDPTKYSWTLIKGETGSQGPTGPTGNGVSNIVKEFYLSTSKTAQSGGSWSTTLPPWEINKYLWTREKITYTNSTTPVYTTPQVSSEWEAINSIEVGGRNYIKDSDWIVTATKDAYAPTNKTLSLVNTITWTEKELTERFKNKTLTFSYLVYNPGTMTYSVTNTDPSMRNRFGIHGTIVWKDSTGVLADKTEYPFAEYLQVQFDVKQRVYMSKNVIPPTGYDTISKLMFGFQPMAKPGTDNDETWILGQPKLEISSTGTDYSPAPEDTDVKIATVTTIANGKNTAYYSASAPTVTGKSENDIWFDTDDGYRMYRFTSGAWVATQFGQNAISANAITANHISSSAVTAGKIAANAVVAGNIAANAVTATTIAANAVTAGKIATDAIVAGNISAGAVTTDKILAEAITSEKLDVQEIFANEGFINYFRATEIDASKITINKIQGDQIEMSGLVSYNALDTNLQPIFDVTGDKTYINGGMIAANTIKANSIDLLSGLTVHGPDNTVTFAIADDGNVTVNGLLRSGNFDDEKKAGYRLSTDGKAILNQAIIRGKVELPNAGITNDYDMSQVEGRNLITNTDYSTGITTNWNWYSATATSTRALIAEDQSPYGSAIEYTWTAAGSSGPYYGIDQSVMDKLESGKTYMVSAWIKSSVAGVINIAFEGRTNTNVTVAANQWTYVTLAVTENKATNRAIHFYYNASQAIGTKLAIHSLKLEAGEVATEWSAAPEDNLNPVRIWAGSTYELRDSAPFRVLQNGDVYAYNATLTGILYGSVDSGFVNIDDKKLTIVNDTVNPSVEYVNMGPDGVIINTDVVLGTLSSNNLEYSNANGTLDLNRLNRLALDTAGLRIELDNTNSWSNNLIISSNIEAVSQTISIGHSTYDSWLNTLIVTANGASGSNGDICFRRYSTSEDIDIQVDGNVKIKNALKSTKHKIEMRSVSNEGWGFYAN